MSKPGGPLSSAKAALDRGAHASASDSGTRFGACCWGVSPLLSGRDRLRSPRWCSRLWCSLCWCFCLSLCLSLCLPCFFAAYVQRLDTDVNFVVNQMLTPFLTRQAC